MVEASLMMPLVILISISVVSLILFFYECLYAQCKLQKELIAIENTSKSLYEVETKAFINEKKAFGISNIILDSEIKEKIQIINESMIIRIGEKGYDFEQ